MQFTRDIRRLLQREALDAESAMRLWGAILDDAVDALEIGAVVAALAVAGETRAELAALQRAAQARLARWSPPASDGLVSIAAYGLAPGESQVAALAAALLRRFEVPVVVHGVLDSPCGISSARVLRELGILPCASLAQADERLAAGGIAFLPVQLLSPSFAALVGLRGRLGIANAAHRVAPFLDPTHGLAVRLTFSARLAGEGRGDDFDDAAEGERVALCWPQPHAPFNPSVRPRIERVRGAVRELLYEADSQEMRPAAHPPLEDAASIAAWIARVVRGQAPLPAPALNLAAACLYAAGRAADFPRARALAAFHAGRLAA